MGRSQRHAVAEGRTLLQGDSTVTCCHMPATRGGKLRGREQAPCSLSKILRSPNPTWEEQASNSLDRVPILSPHPHHLPQAVHKACGVDPRKGSALK